MVKTIVLSIEAGGDRGTGVPPAYRQTGVQEGLGKPSVSQYREWSKR
jgi:hypothetical protein